jgi:formylglycine-generating enzyme required for sulfatase activity
MMGEDQHVVSFDKPFAVSKFELTVDEWDTCFTYGGCTYASEYIGWEYERRPVIYVTWDDAQQYVKWLSKMTGKPYRLLTEVEYEYATRAGTTTVYPWGNNIGDNNANCSGCDPNSKNWNLYQAAECLTLAGIHKSPAK